MEHCQTISSTPIHDLLGIIDNPKSTTAINGKTFYFASLFMNKDNATNAYKLYQLCRRLDDIADDTKNDNSALLVKINQTLAETSVDDNVIIDDIELPTMALQHMIDGMIFDQQSPLINTPNELLTYCYQVAGTVGLMMCKVLGVKDQNAIHHAVDLGIAMQLTNIARDVYEDASMGRRYVPSEWIDDASAKTLTTNIKPQTVQNAQQRLVNLAENYYHSGFNGLRYLPPDVRFAILLAARCYRAIGVKLVSSNNWQQRAVVSLPQKSVITCKTYLQYKRSNNCQLFSKQHQPELHQGLKDYFDINRVTL